MPKNFRFLTPLFILISLIVTPTSISFAQQIDKAKLESDLKLLEEEIAKHKQLIDAKKKEGKSLERDISILDTKIKKSETEIKARDKSIINLNLNIQDKNVKIVSLDKKIDRDKDSIANVFRNMEVEKDANNNLLLSVFGEDTISESFNNLNYSNDLKDTLKVTLDNVKTTKTKLEQIKIELEEGKKEEQNLKLQQLAKKQEIEEDKTEKNTVLKVTKGQEKVYQELLKDNEKKAKEIRNALFSLSGSKDISFGKAYDIAKNVEELTGVRAAYLLGIITVESNLGKNVGTGNWKTDMHPTRDQPIFQTLMDELGLDPDKQPVSKKAWYGYGGAMGPAQFIPSTWVGYNKRVSAITGNSPANPWNTIDAFTASGLLLKDNGATKGTREAEHRAAVCYLAGCGNASKASYQFYGNDVMRYADKYEANIVVLKNT